MKDFHYSRLNSPVRCFALRYYGNMNPRWGGQVNLKVQSNDVPGLISKLEAAWKAADPVHSFDAKFYDEKIQESYRGLSEMIQTIGFMAFLAISIASLGLLGMVIFTTETRLREISIRKVLGASESSLLYLMSKGFLFLLVISGFIAIPSTLILFDKMIFENIAYRAPVGFFDLFAGVFVVLLLALAAIGSQTWRVAKTNPASVLKNE
jgi:ABC-type antimicrobial peptide transport system permease subunit